MQQTRTYNCIVCGDPILPVERQVLSDLCKPCGEAAAKNYKHTIVPLHKSNYIVVTDRNILTGVNNKGGLVK